MRMVAGAILILAAVVLYAANWLGNVIQAPATVGTPASRTMMPAAVVLGLIGAAVLVAGLFMDRKLP